MHLECDNQVALHICNPNFHIISYEKNWSVETSPLDLSTVVSRWLTYSPMSLKGPRIDHICNWLGIYDFCAPTWEECFRYPILTSVALYLIFSFNNKSFMWAIASSSFFYFQKFDMAILKKLNLYPVLGAVVFSLLFWQICSSYRLFKRKEKKSSQRYWKIDSTNISKETKRSF